LCAKFFMKDPWNKTEYAPRRIRALVDLVSFNPPYLVGSSFPLGPMERLALDGGRSGSGVARSFVRLAAPFLSDGGSVLLLVPKRIMPALISEHTFPGLFPDEFPVAEGTDEDLCVLRFRRNGDLR